MKRKPIIKATIMLLAFCLTSGTVFAQQGNSFSWSMGLEDCKTGGLIPFSSPIQSRTGEQYVIQISADDECFVYVIYESPRGRDAYVIHSGTLNKGETWLSDFLQLAAPSGEESFFVIMSREEQKTLMQRITAFKVNPGNTQRRAMMTEVMRISSDSSKFREAPEKPVLMGGASRGDPENHRGVEFSGLETYVKTISIRH